MKAKNILLIESLKANIKSNEESIKKRDKTIARLRDENEQMRQTLLEAMRQIEEVIKL